MAVGLPPFRTVTLTNPTGGQVITVTGGGGGLDPMTPDPYTGALETEPSGFYIDPGGLAQFATGADGGPGFSPAYLAYVNGALVLAPVRVGGATASLTTWNPSTT